MLTTTKTVYLSRKQWVDDTSIHYQQINITTSQLLSSPTTPRRTVQSHDLWLYVPINIAQARRPSPRLRPVAAPPINAMPTTPHMHGNSDRPPHIVSALFDQLARLESTLFGL